MRRRLAITLILLTPLAMWGQMKPSTPLDRFRLSQFTEGGAKEWDLSGDKADFKSETEILVTNLKLNAYDTHTVDVAREPSPRDTMTSPKATFFTKESRAESTAPIQIVGKDYKISGEGWDWNGKAQTMRIRSRVRVVFQQSLGKMVPESHVAPDPGASFIPEPQ